MNRPDEIIVNTAVYAQNIFQPVHSGMYKCIYTEIRRLRFTGPLSEISRDFFGLRGGSLDKNFLRGGSLDHFPTETEQEKPGTKPKRVRRKKTEISQFQIMSFKRPNI